MMTRKAGPKTRLGEAFIKQKTKFLLDTESDGFSPRSVGPSLMRGDVRGGSINADEITPIKNEISPLADKKVNLEGLLGMAIADKMKSSTDGKVRIKMKYDVKEDKIKEMKINEKIDPMLAGIIEADEDAEDTEGDDEGDLDMRPADELDRIFEANRIKHFFR